LHYVDIAIFALEYFILPHPVCLYFVPFLRYSMSNNGMPLKSRLVVIQGHWKRHHLTVCVQVPICVPQ